MSCLKLSPSADFIFGDQTCDLDSIASALALKVLLGTLQDDLNGTHTGFCFINNRESYTYKVATRKGFSMIFGDDSEQDFKKHFCFDEELFNSYPFVKIHLVDNQDCGFRSRIKKTVISSLIDHHKYCGGSGKILSTTNFDAAFQYFIEKLKLKPPGLKKCYEDYKSCLDEENINKSFDGCGSDRIIIPDSSKFIWVPKVPIGSCATLIGSLWMASINNLKIKCEDIRVLQLLVLTIAKDCINFKASLENKRYNQLDKDVYSFLRNYTEFDKHFGKSPEQMVLELRDYEKDMVHYKNLPLNILVEIDSKFFRISKFNVLFCSLPIDLEQVIDTNFTHGPRNVENHLIPKFTPEEFSFFLDKYTNHNSIDIFLMLSPIFVDDRVDLQYLSIHISDKIKYFDLMLKLLEEAVNPEEHSLKFEDCYNMFVWKIKRTITRKILVNSVKHVLERF